MVHPGQNSSLRANWFCSGLLTVLEIVLAAVVPIDVFGNPKFGWLKILNDSVDTTPSASGPIVIR